MRGRPSFSNEVLACSKSRCNRKETSAGGTCCPGLGRGAGRAMASQVPQCSVRGRPTLVLISPSSQINSLLRLQQTHFLLFELVTIPTGPSQSADSGVCP